MHKLNDQIFYSPSDLTTFMESPFACWMDRLKIEMPNSAPLADVADPLLTSLQAKGLKHETRLLEGFQRQGLNVVCIEQGIAFLEQYNQTIKAIQLGADVIYQSALQLDSFRGYPDFLVKLNSPSALGNYSYEVWDTKLSNDIKPKFIMQLCCYAQMLHAIQKTVTKYITIASSAHNPQQLKLEDYYYYYQAIKAQFIQKQKEFNVSKPVNPADSKAYGQWSTYAKQLLKDSDHLSQVANITRSQIKKLNDAGISTMYALGNTKKMTIPHLRTEQLNKLKKQAALQLKSHGQIPPLYEILQEATPLRQGLKLLPPHSNQDVFFDIEGYPLVEGGLEYLWGATFFDEANKRQFKEFWAHDRAQEKQAFSDFINWVYDKWQCDPTMHIYHYANYEIAACKRLMGRYGVCEDKVDHLLRNNVFIDLYHIVKTGLRLGEPQYSIKNVEHLYRNKRETDVGTGADSVAVYDGWRNQPDGEKWQDSFILSSIRDYNIDDCDSTQELVDWLRTQQHQHEISYNGNQEIVQLEIKEAISERHQLRDKLLNMTDTQVESEANLTENLAWMLEFHRREAKPIFWRKFERLDLSEEELYDDIDCLAGCVRTNKEGFKPSPKSRNLAYEYHFNPNQEFKGSAKNYFVLGHQTDEGKEVKLSFVAKESNLELGLIALQMKKELQGPLTLLPDEFVNPEPIPTALANQVEQYDKGLLDNTAIINFLMRRPPNIKNINHGEVIIKSHSPNERLEEIIQAAINLDNSYLTLQGPPGAGKTFTAKHIIAKLMVLGKKVAISSNSHKAINNLLISTAQYCQAQNISAHFACTKETDPILHELNVAIVKNKDILEQVQESCVIGSTAWGFAKPELVNQFDYLIIDEAGQVSVANLVAMSQSSQNILLLGDQMQLGQPSQGSHPLESGASILDYLLKDSPTIPADIGVFLDTTYRMHSKVNQFISDAIYEGQLQSHIENDRQIIEVPKGYNGQLNFDAGVKFINVEHEGNTQASSEEIIKIKVLVKELIGRQYTDKSNTTRHITLDDMLFIAPYNHQRNKLQQALGQGAKVGTVDKFQGQEAPIVFFSLCTSDACGSPRGLDFIFDKHRINVAISRAQAMAIIVGNAKLLTTPVSNIEQMKKINILARLLNSAQ